MRHLLYFLFVSPLAIYAQVNPGPRITALGMTGAALQDAWSIQANPAGIAVQAKLTIAAAYEREFFNPELNRQSALILYPCRKNVFAFSFQNYGFSAYKEKRTGLVYARNFGNVLFVAIGFNYHQVNIDKYGNAETYSVDAGLQYRITEKLLLGTHITNPGKSGYDHQVNATIPVSIEFGASYKFSDKVLLNSGIVKALDSATDIRTGLEYLLSGWLGLRGGVSVNPFIQYAGFGFNYLGFHFDAAASSHPVLGYSPQIAFSYEF